MTRARDIANLVDSNGDIVAGALDNVPASNDASALTTGTLDMARVANGSVTASHIANDTITGTQIAADTIGTSELGAGVVTSTELASNAVIENRIQNGAVSVDKIANSSVAKYRGGVNASGNVTSGIDSYYGSGNDGYYNVGRSGYSSYMWVQNVNGSVGTVQWACDYNSTMYRRNRTDNNSWSSWRTVD